MRPSNKGQISFLSKETSLLALRKSGRPVVAMFANTYFVALGNLGYQWLVSRLHSRNEFAVGRVFWPMKKLNQSSFSSSHDLKTLEGRAVREAEIIFVSLSYENDYPKMVALLKAAGIPVFAFDRNESHPLIVVGGFAPSSNPEPIAPFIDVALLGEGDAVMPAFLDLILAYHDARDRSRILPELAALPGVYVPKFYTVSEGRPAEPISDGFPSKICLALQNNLPVIPIASHTLHPKSAFGRTLLAEACRSCPGACKFCSARAILGPFRQIDPSGFKDLAAPPKAEGIGLVGAGISAHSNLAELIETASCFGRVSLSSIRPGFIDRSIYRLLAASGDCSLTFAPEAGSENLRALSGKVMPDEVLLGDAEAAVEAGFNNIRLYFMFGLPGQTESDLEAIADLTMRIKNTAMRRYKSRGRAGRISLSINPMVPKPHTEYSRKPMMGDKEYRRWTAILRGMLKREGNITLSFQSFREAQIEALLSLCGREAAELILLLADEPEKIALAKWKKNLDELICSPRPEDSPMPFDLIEIRSKI